MTDTIALKQILLGMRLTQRQAAQMLGISEQSFNNKINNKREFKTREINKMIILFKIDNPTPIFFANKVDCKSTDTNFFTST